MKRTTALTLLTVTVALCSIVYELLLGQALSAFLGDTVLRYSVTIGLYLFSMGIGAFLATGAALRRPFLTLMLIELLLAVAGGTSVIALHLLNTLALGETAFALLAHALIVLVGVITGFELPLLIVLRRQLAGGKPEQAERSTLSANYIGALAGTLAFAFIFFPVSGLIPASLFVGLLNALAALALWRIYRPSADGGEVSEPLRRGLGAGAAVLCLCFAVATFRAGDLADYFISLYLGIGG